MISNVESYRQSLIGVLLPVLLATTVGLIFVYISSNGGLGSVSGIIFILVGLYPFARALVRREFDAFEIIYVFVLYMLIEIGLRGFVGIKYGTSFWFYEPNSEHFDVLSLKVFSYSTIALLFLYLGYYSRLGNRWLNVLPRLNFDWDRTKVVICLIIYLVISEAALIVFTSKFGKWEGISSFGRSPSAIQGQDFSGGVAHINSFRHFFWVIFYVSCIYCFSKKRLIWANIMLLFCLLQTLSLFLHYGSKSIIVQAIMVYIITRHYFKKMVTMKMAVGIITGIFILSPFLWHVRSQGIYHWNILGDTYISAFKNPVEFLLPIMQRSYGFDSFALFIEAIDSGRGLELGATMLELFYFFIPRVWWQEKPLNFTVTFVPKYADMDPHSCMAPTLVGELYVNFHLIGVVLGFLLLGVLMKLCHQYLIKRNQNKSGLVIYLPIAIYSPFISEGGIGMITNLPIALFPIILFLWFVKSKDKK